MTPLSTVSLVFMSISTILLARQRTNCLPVSSGCLDKHCNLDKCLPFSCSEGQIVRDKCDCCPLRCLVDAGHLCHLNGPNYCKSGLHCNSVTGTCLQKEMWRKNCLKANCSIVFQRKCPDDSKWVQTPLQPGQCCSQAGHCQCDIEKCAMLAPICNRGFERIRIAKGSDAPGDCCDTFKCRQKQLHCEYARCPTLSAEEEPCPDDSVRPPSYIPQGRCCRIIQRCQCKPGLCLPAHCDPPKLVNVTSKGNGRAGNCCDSFECSQPPTENEAQSTTNGNKSRSQNKRIVELFPPGKDEIKSCSYNGRLYVQDSIWHSSNCEQCQCKAGVTFCKKMTCPNPPNSCSWVAIPDGECCAVCLGCKTEEGDKVLRGDTWQKDECISCKCAQDGQLICQTHMCQVQCDNPRTIPGKCCPQCDEPSVVAMPSVCHSVEHCPLRCEYGLSRDRNSCFVCKCSQNSVQSVDMSDRCQPLTEHNCKKQCAHGYLHDSNGCMACKCAKCPPLHQCYKHCLYGFESNFFGCPTCKCRDRPMDVLIASLDGKRVSAELNKCILIDSERDSGEWWNDGCRHCFCQNAQEFCSLISCPSKPKACPIDQWNKTNDECCASCKGDGWPVLHKHGHTVCQAPGSGRVVADGETWQLSPCIQCTCRVGHVLCHTLQCPPLPCSLPIHDRLLDECCPVCPKDILLSPNKEVTNSGGVVCSDHRGITHLEGTSWRISDCISCQCQSDETIKCYQQSCPEEDSKCNGKLLTLKGLCCPICSDVLTVDGVCDYKQNVYVSGEVWRDGTCRNCTCKQGGQTVCSELQCPPCDQTSRKVDRGICCPPCTRDSSSDGSWMSIGNQEYPITPPRKGIESGQTVNQLLLLGMTAGLIIAIIVVIMFICYLIKRVRNRRYSPKKPPKFCKDATNGGLILLSSNDIGSTTVMKTDRQLSMECDEQNESLLSRTSESSATPSSDSSNVSQQHPASAANLLKQPLKNKSSTNKTTKRPASIDLGRKGPNSFRKKLNNKKIISKHYSFNV